MFSALHLLHDPQDFAEKLFKKLEKSTEKFEVRLMLMALISRLIGVHQVCIVCPTFPLMPQLSSVIRLTHANVWESMGKPCSCIQFIKAVFFTTSHTRICISNSSHARIHVSTTSHARIYVSATSHARICVSTTSHARICQCYKSRENLCQCYKSRENLCQCYKSRENLCQCYKSHENPYQILQVTCTASERAMKSKVCMVKSLLP